jgi:hypothetical protein
MDSSKSLAQLLLDQYGPMIGGKDLYQALGFRSYAAFRLANEQMKIPIPVYQLHGRRGWFARTDDLANWLINLGNNKPTSDINPGKLEGGNP